ncbi:3-methyladenine DNA glycosylase [Balneola sp. MJW-20]|uniref:3-methyladenine DNA glycosylase n=1 Tax=Gracilimonas aurantiaca TaxID=3234185 RepID=UPI003466B48E
MEEHTIQKEIIPKDAWQMQALEHEARVSALLDEYLENRSKHIKEPVMDFLFEYYAFRPSHLAKWSPGLRYTLQYNDISELPEYCEWKTEGDIAYLDISQFPEKRISSVKWIHKMLKNSRAHKPSFACFGMHEWAMVYKTSKPRHNQIPLRMEENELAEFVESRPLLCTHFDAFRFFTKEAKPMNRYELSREKFENMEQPGCIHTNMDLYKWAFKSWPWISSSLVLDAFELAYEARVIDMKASPYDMREYGLEPIRIETEEGRKIYKEEQEKIFQKGKPVRAQIITEYEYLLSSLDTA